MTIKWPSIAKGPLGKINLGIFLGLQKTIPIATVTQKKKKEKKVINTILKLVLIGTLRNHRAAF